MVHGITSDDSEGGKSKNQFSFSNSFKDLQRDHQILPPIYSITMETTATNADNSNTTSSADIGDMIVWQGKQLLVNF